MTSFDLLYALKVHEKINATANFRLWWKNALSFEVILGSILTQQSKWEKVQESIENLKDHLSLERICGLDESFLAQKIKASGLYNQKAKRILSLCKNISLNFGDFDSFCKQVSREWLLKQKGIGFESADAILCYACEREILVVDAYTARLLSFYGYEFESYDELQEWMSEGILSDFKKVQELYGFDISLHEVYARFHGKVVEFCKANMGKSTLKRGILGLE